LRNTKERAVERIGREDLAAHAREPIDPFPKILGLDRDQDPHLRRDLDHASRPPSARVQRHDVRQGEATDPQTGLPAGVELDDTLGPGCGVTAASSTKVGGPATSWGRRPVRHAP